MLRELICKFFENEGIKSQVLNEEKNVVRVGFNGEYKDEIETLLFIDDDERSVHLVSFNYCKVPKEKLADIYKLCSDMNGKYRWVKFYVNDNNEVTVEDDAIIEPGTCGPEALELILRMVKICDQAYGTFMKTIFS